MARITCAISGLKFTCDYAPIVINHTDGYYHPIFALPYRKLYGLYSKHCSGHLTATDSYLLFLSFLHSTEQIDWTVPASLSPDSTECIHLVETNLKQLIEVIELSNVIDLPSFKQPSYKVTVENSSLDTIHNFIALWESNIEAFKAGSVADSLREKLQKVENKLSWYIKSGESIESYSHVVAQWADKVAIFPPQNRDRWMKIIRSCFNSAKMFSTPLQDLKAVKFYCEDNIEAGSIHSHTLFKVLREGISRHTDFLGMSPIALGYTLLPVDSSKNDAEVAALIASAPTEPPTPLKYKNRLDYIKAKLKYNTLQIQLSKKALIVTGNKGEEL